MAKVSDIQPGDVLPGSTWGRGIQAARQAWLWQIARFGIVGVFNTGIDVLTLNGLLWRFPTHSTNLLLAFNSLAYFVAAVNSFVFNKYWTFRSRQGITGRELVRFAIVTLVGFLCSDSLIWIFGTLLHPLISRPVFWANASKLSSVIGTMLISYLGMRLWVFRGGRTALPGGLAHTGGNTIGDDSEENQV